MKITTLYRYHFGIHCENVSFCTKSNIFLGPFELARVSLVDFLQGQGFALYNGFAED